ncbi:MAG: transposase [Spirochaetaceae bacterium]|nr:transposase [Spirochaetaceae bacterium]
MVLPVIEAGCRGKGRPPKVSHYKAFCGILYILRTGRPWRDLPEEYGRWHVVMTGFPAAAGGDYGGKFFLSRKKRRG